MNTRLRTFRAAASIGAFAFAAVVFASALSLAAPDGGPTVEAEKGTASSGNDSSSETVVASLVELANTAATAVSSGPASPPPQPASQAGVNRFNRLMKSPSDWNPPPSRDGIHDPNGVGTVALQKPKDAFEPLPKSNSGNRIDWVAALDEGLITPRYDKVDESKQAVVFDFNVVREVKGTMPDVVYPHKQHTQWLDCTNCHPAIFIPKKGANQISMASILMGKQCGVCHGKVAFPVSECRKCHSGGSSTSLAK